MNAFVANLWQDDQPLPSTKDGHQRVCAGQSHIANDDHQKSLSVPCFPRYCYYNPYSLGGVQGIEAGWA
ncbi:MAG: hypothetical protein M3548_01840, partial [Actinomycetota bacterium]|nr:hypothetical protein [Actinomycetota bacterium]